jgi:putative ABC transport system ATP-binding protein
MRGKDSVVSLRDSNIYKYSKHRYMEKTSNRTTSLKGESGAGKTTLLKLLNKMNIPDERKVYYNKIQDAQLNV